jgi:FMN-dependent NADH-azoreductase
LTDVAFIHVEGVAMGPDAPAAAHARARATIDGLLPEAVAA